MHLWYGGWLGGGFASDAVGTVVHEDDYVVFKKGWRVTVNLYAGGFLVRKCFWRKVPSTTFDKACAYVYSW